MGKPVMRLTIVFLIVQFTTTAYGQYNGGFSNCAPPRRVVRSYQQAPVYNNVVVKEVIREREVPVLAYPVAQQYAPNPYVMQAQFKQYFTQLQRMQQELQDSLSESQAFSAQFSQQQVSAQQVPIQQAPPPQPYEQQYQQMPQPYGAYAPQQQPQNGYGYGQGGYVQRQQPPPQPQQNGGCIPAAELLRMLLGPQQNDYHQQPPANWQPNGQQYPQAEESLEGYASVLEARCASCHSGRNPKGGLDLSKIAQMNFQQRKTTFLRVLRGEMPLDASGNPMALPPEELDALKSEMFTPQEIGTEMRNSAMRSKDKTAASLVVRQSE
jgi:hypothetical protein